MRRPHIRSVAVAVAVATAVTGLAGTALADPAPSKARTAVEVFRATARNASVVTAARAAAFAHADASGVGAGDELRVQDVMFDPEGGHHVRFQRAHRDMDVLGGDLVVHLDRQLAYTGVTTAAGESVQATATDARITPRQAAAKAADAARGDAGTAELVVDARDGDAVLAYQVTVTDSALDAATGSRTVVVDAVTGEVRSNTPDADEFLSPKLRKALRARGETLDPVTSAPAPATRAAGVAVGAAGYPAIAQGTGKTLFAGSVPLTTTQTSRGHFQLKDPSRYYTETRDAKGQYTETFGSGSAITGTVNTWGNGATSDRNSAAADAQYGITETLDFYKETFGRAGITGKSTAARAMVHWGHAVGNAFWDPACGCMLYGDGDGDMIKKPLVVLDVTGHELTHGVVDATAKLEPTYVDRYGNQYGEPGSLNESLADIFGSNVEFHAANAKNPPNYLLGEKLGLEQKFLRRLDHPSLDKLERAVDYWSKAADDTEVHAGSGISSHAYYLLAEGSGKKTIGGVSYDSPTYDGGAVKGIGRAKATAVFYRALTRYMVSTTDFHDARRATLNAARDMYGATSTEYRAVDRAWAAVNVTAANTPAGS